MSTIDSTNSAPFSPTQFQPASAAGLATLFQISFHGWPQQEKTRSSLNFMQAVLTTSNAPINERILYIPFQRLKTSSLN
jgi:hypothetical protein